MPRMIPLELVFRGDRDYLQGTALYSQIIATCAARTPDISDWPGSISFHRLLMTQPDLHFGTPANNASVAAVFRLGAGTHTISGWLSASERPVIAREQFDEEPILAATRRDGDAITLISNPQCSTIEALVAMTKSLHHCLFPTPERKWLFARLAFARPLQDSDLDGLRIHFCSATMGRTTLSDVSSTRRALGHIYFSAPVVE
jgi:hypothetical protein